MAIGWDGTVVNTGSKNGGNSKSRIGYKEAVTEVGLFPSHKLPKYSGSKGLENWQSFRMVPKSNLWKNLNKIDRYKNAKYRSKIHVWDMPGKL